MELLNLQLGRVVIHEVFARADDKTKVPPKYGETVESLDPDATDALRNRIVSAMASPARCIFMTLEKTNIGSMGALISQLANADSTLFVVHSKDVADLLVDAQKFRNIPGGILVVFSGTAGIPARRLVGVIKAEVHNGFNREEQEGVLALKFLKNLLLTAQTKLYKIGLYIEDPQAASTDQPAWQAYLYDETLTLANRYGAAQYFYDGFLGCAFPQSSARQTKQFHDLTKGFIRAMKITEEDRAVLHNALITYLRADQTPTVSVEAFGQAYLGEAEIRDAYMNFMLSKDFPESAINKDLSDVNHSLRLRKLTFRNQIRVIGPAEGFENLMDIESIAGSLTVHGETTKWTKLTIKADISSQE